MRKNYFLLLPFLLLLLSSCALIREHKLERDFDAFRMWVAAQQDQAEVRTEEEWRKAKSEFGMMTANLDAQADQLTNELKEEYESLKQQFEELEEEQMRLRVKERWRRDLLEDAADIAAITPESLWQAYATFMSNVRLRHSKWTEDDWKMAHEVYKELAERQKEINKSVTQEDQIRIKSLQMEYHSLRTATDEEEDKTTES